MTTYQLDFEPIGAQIEVDESTSILIAAQEAGIGLAAVCGGIGVCGACRIRLVSGVLSEIGEAEANFFSQEDMVNGWRLACQAFPRSDLKIEVPPESLLTSQRLQMEGELRNVPFAPGVKAVPFTLPPPGLDDLRADWERFKQTFPQTLDHDAVDLPVLQQFSSLMRQEDWKGQAVFGHTGEVVAFLPAEQAIYGLAVDIGTTKMAAYLVDLGTGQTVSKRGAMNPQIAYGEDVVARITYANQGESQRLELQKRVVEILNEILSDLCDQAGADVLQVVDLVLVGNTAIHHLVAGLPVRQLGQAPYVPAVRQAIRFPAREIGLYCAPNAQVYFPPNIAGYVGADHVAMLLAGEVASQTGVTVALDIGTNTEISLAKRGRLVSCSCASGPAFEGAHIHAGMRAVPGAIERAQFHDTAWQIATVDGKPPVGICGSGILDVVAELFRTGQIDFSGRLTDLACQRVSHEKGGAIVLVSADVSGTGKDILVTREDIREIQLAKAAIRAGVDALLTTTDTKPEEIVSFIIAGAFGTYLDLRSAIRIGMFPKLPLARYRQIGNAAGAGAQLMLFHEPSRKAAKEIVEKMDYVELTTYPGFMDSYVNAISFEPVNKE